MSRPPVIIIGMHRSGTTMITQQLEQLGLFVGDQKEVNNEAYFFWDINNWIFDICTCKAELPHNFRYLNPAAKEVIVRDLHYFTQSFQRKKFLGWDKFFKYKDLKDLDIPWGWKDPKNSFTLELWKEVFPQAKILHIYRNPLDSIGSYIKRDLVMKNNFRLNWKKWIKRRLLIGNKYHANFRLYSLEEGYNLWEEYVSQCLLVQDNVLHIRYEDFLEQPEKFLAEAAAFCGLTSSESAIQQQVSKVRKDRAFAFMQDENAKAVYEKIKNRPIMQQLGYDQISGS